MAKLVAFYSRADENYFGGQLKTVSVGNTEIMAKKIADMTGADMFKIEQRIPYSADYKECVEEARRDFEENARPAVKHMPANLDGYDEIYLGYPNYCSTMPMAVYTFLEAYDWTGKTIHPFCTHEGSGLLHTVVEIQKIAKGAAVGRGLAVRGSNVNNADKMISDWLK